MTTNLPALKSLVLANVHGDIKDRLATMDWAIRDREEGVRRIPRALGSEPWLKRPA